MEKLDYDNEEIIMQYFVDKYEGLFKSVLKKINFCDVAGYCYEDCHDLYLRAIERAMITYDPTVSKFSTFLTKIIHSALNNYKKSLYTTAEVSLDDIIGYNENFIPLRLGDNIVGERVYEPNFEDEGPLIKMQNEILKNYLEIEKKIWFDFVDGCTIRDLAKMYQWEYSKLRRLITRIKNDFSLALQKAGEDLLNKK
jgi:hypothetical protein